MVVRIQISISLSLGVTVPPDDDCHSPVTSTVTFLSLHLGVTRGAPLDQLEAVTFGGEALHVVVGESCSPGERESHQKTA